MDAYALEKEIVDFYFNQDFGKTERWQKFVDDVKQTTSFTCLVVSKSVLNYQVLFGTKFLKTETPISVLTDIALSDVAFMLRKNDTVSKLKKALDTLDPAFKVIGVDGKFEVFRNDIVITCMPYCTESEAYTFAIKIALNDFRRAMTA